MSTRLFTSVAIVLVIVGVIDLLTGGAKGPALSCFACAGACTVLLANNKRNRGH